MLEVLRGEGANLVEEAAAACRGDDEPAVVGAQRAEHVEQILREKLRDGEVGCKGRCALAEALVEEAMRLKKLF